MPMAVGYIRVPFEQRFWSKVTKTDDCWVWTGAVNSRGYGHIKVSGKVRTAHRLSFEMSYGKIEGDLVPDHLCENKLCVRPEHMELVTRGENVRRWYRKRRNNE